LFFLGFFFMSLVHLSVIFPTMRPLHVEFLLFFSILFFYSLDRERSFLPRAIQSPSANSPYSQCFFFPTISRAVISPLRNPLGHALAYAPKSSLPLYLGLRIQTPNTCKRSPCSSRSSPLVDLLNPFSRIKHSEDIPTSLDSVEKQGLQTFRAS